MRLLWKHYFQSHFENCATQEEWREGAKEKDGRWSDGISADEKHQGECLWQEEEGDQKDERPAKVSDEEGVGWNAFKQGKEYQEIVAEVPWNEVVLNEFHFIWSVSMYVNQCHIHEEIFEHPLHKGKKFQVVMFQRRI